MKVRDLRPEQHGVDIVVKVIERQIVKDKNDYKIAECLVGDETGVVQFTVKNDQVELAAPDRYLSITGATIDMQKGNMGLVIASTFGHIEEMKDVSFEPRKDYNMSLVEWELIPVPYSALPKPKFLSHHVRRQKMEPTTASKAHAKPREEPVGVDSEATLYDHFSQIPSVGKATCLPSQDGSTLQVALQFSQKNLPANAQRKFLTNFTLSEASFEHGVVDTSLPVEIKDVVLQSSTNTGDKTLIIRSGANSTSAILEIWGRGRLLRELHVPKTLHGAVYNDGWFGTGAAWSPDGAKVAYVAERPISVQTPEWGLSSSSEKTENDKGDDSKTNNSTSSNKAAPKGWRGVGAFEEDWGELNTGKKAPSIFILDCTTWEVTPLNDSFELPEDTSIGQPQWSPEGDVLLFVGWHHAPPNFPDFPQRLGVVYCFNRPCALYAIKWPCCTQKEGQSSGLGKVSKNGVARAIAGGDNENHPGSAFSPRFSPDGRTLVYLSQAAAVETGVHNGTTTMLSLQWQDVVRVLDQPLEAPSPTSRTLVDIVWTPSTPSDFPGLYCTMLPDQPFVNDSTVLATTQWRSLMAVVAIDLNTGAVQRVSPENGASWSVIGSCTGWVLASESSPSQPFKLYAVHLPENTKTNAENSNNNPWLWSRVPLPVEQEIPQEVQGLIDAVQTEILQLGGENGQPTYEAVVLYSKDRPGPQPTVITPHGGPHSCYAASYFTPYTFLVSVGYNVVLLNYRGSTGFGEASIQSLPGNIGTNDVEDCMASLKAAIKAGYVDESKVAVIGGSHGGFLTGHLMGQHPEVFKCAVLRNPVCDLALMVNLSDIPDWCFIEAFGTAEGKKRAGSKATAADFERFSAVSPYRYIDSVQGPMLFMLGAKDRRVPLEDGKRYIAAIKGRKDAPEVRCLVFPEDTHALDKPQTEFEQWVNVAAWLQKHM